MCRRRKNTGKKHRHMRRRRRRSSSSSSSKSKIFLRRSFQARTKYPFRNLDPPLVFFSAGLREAERKIEIGSQIPHFRVNFSQDVHFKDGSNAHTHTRTFFDCSIFPSNTNTLTHVVFLDFLPRASGKPSENRGCLPAVENSKFSPVFRPSFRTFPPAKWSKLVLFRRQKGD